MSELKILTNSDHRGSGVVALQGTKVTAGGVEIKPIGHLELQGCPDGVWELTIKVAVNPATLFETREQNASQDAKTKKDYQFFDHCIFSPIFFS